jgi:hypothetical protein
LEFAFADNAQASALALASQRNDIRNSTVTSDDTEFLQERVLAYEQMQELQSQRVINHVCLSPLTPDVFASDLSDLVHTHVNRDYKSSAQTCYVLGANELSQFLEQQQNNLPDFLFLRPCTEPKSQDRTLIESHGYQVSTVGLMSHPGCYQRQRST